MKWYREWDNINFLSEEQSKNSSYEIQRDGLF